MSTRTNQSKPLLRQWTFWEYDALGEDNFNRLCLLLLKGEISAEVQPNNKKGPDSKHDAFLLHCNNNYNRDGLWWFQFKFKEFGRAVNSGRNQNLKAEFKQDFKSELEGIIKRSLIPKNYIIITNVELTGGDFSTWFHEEILSVFSSKIQFIRYWDFSQLNGLLDKYSSVKKQFEEIIFGLFTPSQIKLPKRQKSTKGLHILQDPAVRFYEKLSYLLDIIANLQKPREHERKQALDNIQKDNNLTWHFLHNLKNINWFPTIKDNLIKSLVEQRVDTAVKYQLLGYFKLCADQYSDEIIPLLLELEDNTRNPNILADFIKTLAKLKPSKKENLNPVWRVLKILVEHQHPWVRKEIPDTLKALAEYDLNKSLRLLEKLFLFNPVPRDVTQGSPTLALTFQGNDNENWVFEQSARVLSQLMADRRFSAKTLDLAIKLEIQFIKQGKKKLKKATGITLDYSCMWLANEDPFGKLEYMYDRRERLALEIEKCLDEFAKSDVEFAKNIFAKLLQANYEVFHLAVIEVLTRHPLEYLDLIENIVFNKDLWVIHNIQNYFLQVLTQRYFELRQDRLPEYIQSVRSLDYRNDFKKTARFKQDLFISIPENIRTKEVLQELKQLEAQLKVPAKIEKSFVIRSFNGPRPDIFLEERKTKNDDELVKIMEDCTAGQRTADHYDLSHIFEELIKVDPDRLPILLDKMNGKKITLDFAGSMFRAYIEAKQSDLQNIIKVFWKLQKSNTWARQEMVRFLDKECRKREIIKLAPNLFKEVKEALFDLASDPSPDDDETIKSSDPRPEDAINRGINSVRGATVEALAALAHYFPQDTEITEKIKSLSQDRTNAVKATLIYNLKYLVKKNYSLCKLIVTQFKDVRDPEIDFALIYYFSSLTHRQFQANIDFIKLLFNDTNKEIQRLLGELIGTRYIAGFNLRKFIDLILKQGIGDVEVRRSLAFTFESRLAKQIESEKHKQIFGFLVHLLDPQREPDFWVRERASFFLVRDEIKPQYFRILYRNKVFDSILNDELNIPAQSHVIDYLNKCVSANEYVDKCIEILHKQALRISGIWDDQLTVQKIADVLRKIFESKTVGCKTKLLADEIFDKGLERGWEEFYKLFYNFKQESGIQQ